MSRVNPGTNDMLRNLDAFQNFDHHCPRCDNELSVARSQDGNAFALALACDEPYCGYVLALSAAELKLILSLGEFEAEASSARAAG